MDWASLQAHDIDRTSPVTLKLRNAKFNQAMDWILAAASNQKTRLIAMSGVGGIRIVPVDAAIFSMEPRQDDLVAMATAMQLDRKLPEVKFSATRLSDAIDFLRDASDAPIFVNWKAIEIAGATSDTPVTMELKNVKLSRCLTLILSLVADDNRLGYGIDEGIISITTRNELAKNTVTHVYDIRDLLRSLDNNTAAAREQAICAMILQTIDPKSWRQNAGSGSNSGDLRHCRGSSS